MTIEEFIEKCQKRNIPNTPMARVKVLVREIVEGAYFELWRRDFRVVDSRNDGSYYPGLWFNKDDKNEYLFQYLRVRWPHGYPNIDLLIGAGYFDVIRTDANLPVNVRLAEKSTALLNESDPATIFISYKRSESSAFALLIHDRLRAYGYEPFLDMQIEAGKKWEDVLKATIEQVDYFVLLLGKETLKSEVTLREIEWANSAGKTILIIRHNGFKFENADWANISPEIQTIIKDTQHASEVLAESPSEYNAALERLINYFKFTEARTE